MPEPNRPGGVLVTDFDGTLTRRDFYRLVIDELLPPGTPDFWAEYLAGRITHFEAIRRTFAAAPAGEAALVGLARKMGLEPDLKGEVERLRREGWRVVVASAGCLWYIQMLLDEAGVVLEVHANPGHIEGDRLAMTWPVDSPYFSPETGIDKAAVVREALGAGGPVAFAGDGPPDLGPALLVPPRLRFARGYLAHALTKRREPFRPFDRWAEVARMVVEESG
ncbi:MAG TPA: HAD-IB family phosphatase, partial [Isosphaeraceae bacterium]